MAAANQEYAVVTTRRAELVVPEPTPLAPSSGSLLTGVGAVASGVGAVAGTSPAGGRDGIWEGVKLGTSLGESLAVTTNGVGGETGAFSTVGT